MSTAKSSETADWWRLYDERVGLTEAERHAYIKVRRHELGVRELARKSSRSPGTVGNLLQRAEEKLGEAGV